ncbi:MAG: gliding motility protein GldN [Bacteroidetes bacterium]|nr:gliding motility protein GldN [Bacteroidota bacterium]MBS1975803.1 gliding motility protein GldN [Bacteroidota bacterium]
MRKILVGLALLTFSQVAFAQLEEGQVNPNSLLNIPKYEQLYKVRVWRDIDLREKQNKGFFARSNEITDLIIKAVKSGELADIYVYDSLDDAVSATNRKKSKEQFFEAMQAQVGQTFVTWDPTKDFYTDDKVTYNGKNYIAMDNSKGKNPETSADQWQVTQEGKATYYVPSQIYKLKLMEDVIFDKRRSRLYYDMQSIELVVFNEDKGVDVSLGVFKYKDLEKLFRNHPKQAVWFNRYNTAENKNYADAFLLRLFHGTIYKIENPDNDQIFDLYKSHMEAVWAMEWEEMKLMEKEHNLWEY